MSSFYILFDFDQVKRLGSFLYNQDERACSTLKILTTKKPKMALTNTQSNEDGGKQVKNLNFH